VNLGVDLKIAESYIADMNQRLMVYRKVASSRTEAELEAAIDEVRDRYGPPPPSVLNLAEYGRLRVLGDALGVESIDREGRFAVIRFRPTAPIDPVRLVHVLAGFPGASMIPPVSLKLDLEATDRPASAPTSKDERTQSSFRASGSGKGRPASSWWTARATAGEVATGFTKEAILRTPQGDPRAEGGVFARVESLLRAIA
jgi:hypothetical protein